MTNHEITVALGNSSLSEDGKNVAQIVLSKVRMYEELDEKIIPLHSESGVGLNFIAKNTGRSLRISIPNSGNPLKFSCRGEDFSKWGIISGNDGLSSLSRWLSVPNSSFFANGLEISDGIDPEDIVPVPPPVAETPPAPIEIVAPIVIPYASNLNSDVISKEPVVETPQNVKEDDIKTPKIEIIPIPEPPPQTTVSTEVSLDPTPSVVATTEIVIEDEVPVEDKIVEAEILPVKEEDSKEAKKEKKARGSRKKNAG